MAKFEYRKEFDKHVNDIWTLQARIKELEEFNVQWSDIFDRLKKRTGNDCRVNIENYLFYQTYMRDKFHIVISDLHSLLDGQIIDQESVIKNARDHLIIHPESYYVDPDPKVSFLNRLEMNREELARERELWAKHDAKRTREGKIEQLKSLYPNIQSDLLIRDADQEDLKKTVKLLSSKVEATRNVFNHKHQKVIVKRNAKKGDLADVTVARSVIDDYFKILNAIGVVHHDSSYGLSPSFPYESTVESAIDIILFGSLRRATDRYEYTSDGIASASKEGLKYYYQFRNRFYDSDRILTLIPKDK